MRNSSHAWQAAFFLGNARGGRQRRGVQPRPGGRETRAPRGHDRGIGRRRKLFLFRQWRRGEQRERERVGSDRQQQQHERGLGRRRGNGRRGRNGRRRGNGRRGRRAARRGRRTWHLLRGADVHERRLLHRAGQSGGAVLQQQFPKLQAARHDLRRRGRLPGRQCMLRRLRRERFEVHRSPLRAVHRLESTPPLPFRIQQWRLSGRRNVHGGAAARAGTRLLQIDAARDQFGNRAPRRK